MQLPSARRGKIRGCWDAPESAMHFPVHNHHFFACAATFIGNPNRSMNPRAAVTS
jgi:hypothetical protein